MTPYTVDWTPDAENSLTLIWLQTSDPAATAAQAKIDQLLARNPSGHGELLHEGLYRLIEHPLTVYYSIDHTHKTVEVTEVWYTP